jgi:tRNA1(Val) A37 N6-methylase TrmN6
MSKLQTIDEILELHFTNGDGTGTSFTSEEAKAAIEAMVKDIISYEVIRCNPPFNQHDYGFMSANAINNRIGEQRQRATKYNLDI